ncbi:hypothetical protein [Brevundimonas sp. Root1279]|uniref:hypothetical protein n=1 Tax=Brevundimonas sp. Root1279 TaxID=1736443 RepID=UPI0012E3C404|nr:hypothetical protein [Brevundimonas sp. Root1279]
MAAQWTMVAVAGLQLLLTLGGLLYIRWTLIETRRAVSESAKATDAARDAVKVTRDSALAQLRAYIHVGSLRVVDMRPGQIPKAQFVTKNAGQTPAHAVITRMVFFTDPDPTQTKLHGLHVPLEVSRATFGAGQEAWIDFPDTGEPLTQDQINGFETGKWGFGLAGYISYRDIFGRFRRTIFRGYVRGEKIRDGEVRLTVANKHVRAS